MFNYTLWRQNIGTRLPQRNRWSAALQDFDDALKNYSENVTSLAYLRQAEAAFTKWRLSFRPKTEAEGIVATKMHLPQTIKKQVDVLDVDVITVHKNLEEWMQTMTERPQRFRWGIHYTINPTFDYNIIVTVPVYALSGTGKEMPDKYHYGARLTGTIRSHWSSAIGKIWLGAEFVYIEGSDEVYKDKIKFKIDWITRTQAMATPVLNTNKVLCVRTRPGGLSHNVDLDGTVNSGVWGADDGKWHQDGFKCAIAHEFGHLLGNPDEYNTVYFENQNITNRASIMAQHESNKPLASHYYLIGTALAKHFGYPMNKCYIKYHQTTYQVSSNHPYL